MSSATTQSGPRPDPSGGATRSCPGPCNDLHIRVSCFLCYFTRSARRSLERRDHSSFGRARNSRQLTVGGGQSRQRVTFCPRRIVLLVARQTRGGARVRSRSQVEVR